MLANCIKSYMKLAAASFRMSVAVYIVVHREPVLVKLLAQNLLNSSPELLHLYIDLVSECVFKSCICVCVCVGGGGGGVCMHKGFSLSRHCGNIHRHYPQHTIQWIASWPGYGVSYWKRSWKRKLPSTGGIITERMLCLQRAGSGIETWGVAKCLGIVQSLNIIT